MSMFSNYLNAEPAENLFGEPVNDEGRALNAAARMYEHTRIGGASHMAAYAILVEEAGAELADAAAAWFRGGYEGTMYPPESIGWTHKELAEREAGLLDHE